MEIKLETLGYIKPSKNEYELYKKIFLLDDKEKTIIFHRVIKGGKGFIEGEDFFILNAIIITGTEEKYIFKIRAFKKENNFDYLGLTLFNKPNEYMYSGFSTEEIQALNNYLIKGE